MNVLFLTLLDLRSIDEHNLYTDLLREFVKNGHEVYAVSPLERRQGQQTHVVESPHFHLLRLKTLNLQKTGLLEKGIGTVTLPHRYRRGIGRYFGRVKFDLVLYSTPPITLVGTVRWLKRRDGAKTYLLLKDIFPQNAVDIGLMKKAGLKGLLYRYFRKKEKQLYRVSDRIGCMSRANVDYLLSHNPEVDAATVEICPNSIEVREPAWDVATRRQMREKYGLPQEEKVFVYGGNLGLPQGIPFVVECLKSCADLPDVHFLIVGDGTEYARLEAVAGQANVTLLRRVPQAEYDLLVAACDAGMIFLDNRFTIPNYPSRLLGYMQAGLPVLAATDACTDVGDFLEKHGVGMRCPADSVAAFGACVREMCRVTYDREAIVRVLREHYSVAESYAIIEKGLK